MRLSGLTTGAKLSLVQASRSPSVISVALQLPASGQSPSVRLQNKFASNVSVWQILRRFEETGGNAQDCALASRGAALHNFTQRGTARMAGDGATTGSGRLYYAMPVVGIMGRELGTFVELQKTLGQLGFNGGTCLLRLSFRDTGQPLEEAMVEISRYFDEPIAESSHAPEILPQNLETTAAHTPVAAAASDVIAMGNDEASPSLLVPAGAASIPPQAEIARTSADLSNHPPSNSTAKAASGFTIFSPPSAATPVAALQVPFIEEDYLPTVSHAQQHQARLNNESRNRRLQSDKEIEEEKQALAEKLSTIERLTIRVRLPDNSSVNQTFDRLTTSRDLYTLCRELMDRPNNEPFSIKYPGSKGGLQLLPENDKKLVMDLAWQVRVVVTVVWGEGMARTGPSLKPQYLAQAQELKVVMPGAADDERGTASQAKPQAPPPRASTGSGGGGDIEKKLKGFLRLGKK